MSKAHEYFRIADLQRDIQAAVRRLGEWSIASGIKPTLHIDEGFWKLFTVSTRDAILRQAERAGVHIDIARKYTRRVK